MKNEIQNLIEFMKNTQENQNQVVIIGKIPENLVKVLSEESDRDLSNYYFSIDAYAIKHILKNHQNQSKEHNRGQEVITEQDLELLPEILENPDIVFYDGKNKLGKDCFQFQKSIENKFIVIKEVRTGKKHLALNTMRIFINKKENPAES